MEMGRKQWGSQENNCNENETSEKKGWFDQKKIKIQTQRHDEVVSFLYIIGNYI